MPKLVLFPLTFDENKIDNEQIWMKINSFKVFLPVLKRIHEENSDMKFVSRVLNRSFMTLGRLYHRTDVLCCKESSSHKKKYTHSKLREEKYSSRFLQL